MTLKEKKFRGTDSEGNANDLSEEKDIAVVVNGINNGVKLEHLFRKYALHEEDGAIFGTSLLAYFTPKDGKLVDAEGHTVEFLTSDGKPFLIIDNTEEPFFDDDAEINFEYVQAFSQLIGISKPDELFADILNDTEKQAFISERNTKLQADAEAETKRLADAEAETKRIADAEAETKRIADAEAETKRIADAEAETKRIADAEVENKRIADAEANNKADAEARGKVDPEYFVDVAKYKVHQRFYGNLQTFKEYIDGNVHFFYGNKWSEYVEDPFILVKRGADWWEDVETDVDNMIEDDKTVQLEFVDGEERKKVTLDIEKGTISVSKVEA